MADSLSITLRARNEVERDFVSIHDWCVDHKVPMSAILNAFLPAIAYALNHSSFTGDTDGKLYIRSDFGDVPVDHNFSGRKLKALKR